MKYQNFVVPLVRGNLISQQLTEEGSSLVLLSFSLVLRAGLSVPLCLQAQLKRTNRVLKVVKVCLQCCYRTWI